ncbi:MAG: hypothetical protein U9Q12_01220 [Patescibacteria group bacterium]|nr:hypothetical protein [Patescibacteria group bacterium]
MPSSKKLKDAMTAIDFFIIALIVGSLLIAIILAYQAYHSYNAPTRELYETKNHMKHNPPQKILSWIIFYNKNN